MEGQGGDRLDDPLFGSLDLFPGPYPQVGLPEDLFDGRYSTEGQVGAYVDGRTVRAPLNDLARIMEDYRSQGLDDPFLGRLDLVPDWF